MAAMPLDDSPMGAPFLFPIPCPVKQFPSAYWKKSPATCAPSLLDVLEPSPQRIVPKCIHFGLCGGCHYQHFSYPTQLTVKAGILRDQLMRIGKIDHPPLSQAVPSSSPWNYRNHVQFHLTRDGKLGYIAAASHSVMPIRECHLPEPSLDALWPRLEFDPDLGLDRVSLRLGLNDQSMVVLESESPMRLSSNWKPIFRWSTCRRMTWSLWQAMTIW